MGIGTLNRYTVNDVGTIFAGTLGNAIGEFVYKFAKDHGMQPNSSAEQVLERGDSLRDWEGYDELWDDCEEWLNTNTPVTEHGIYFWGCEDQDNDWGLWPVDECWNTQDVPESASEND